MIIGRQGSCCRVLPVIRTAAAVFIVVAVLSGFVSGAVFLKNGSEVTGNNTAAAILSVADQTSEDCSIDFFYNTQCGACHVAMAYLNEYQAAHPDVIISSYDLYNSSENRDLFEQYKTAYNRTYISVPVLFLENAGLEGESAIRTNFNPLIDHCYQNQNSSALLSNPIQKPQVRPHRTVISIPLVLIAGLVDGINPCAVAVLIFLLIFLMAVRQRQRVILTGSVFISAIFFFYFLAGTGIIPITGNSGFVKTFSLIAGILAICAGCTVFLKPYISRKETGGTAAKKCAEKAINAANKLAVPIAFILGLLLGVLELPCAGGIYLTIIDMISFRVNIAPGIVYLTLYNLAFIVPLILMTIIVCLVMRTGNGEAEPDQGNTRGISVFTGLMLLIFAFLILSGLL